MSPLPTALDAMKRPKRLNPIQVAASAAGAVLAAVIASFFGVAGTIIGTAVGSIVATTVSAIVWESIERGHEAVRQVVVKEHGPLLHRGSTESAGEITHADAEASAVEAQVDAGLDTDLAAGRPADGADVTGEPGSPAAETAAAGRVQVRQQSPLDPTHEEQIGTAAAASCPDGPGLEVTGPRRLVASNRGGRPAEVRRTAVAPERRDRGRRIGPFRRRWVLAVGSIVGVFVLALGIVTVVEVIAGRPLSSLTGGGHTPGGTSFGNIVTGTPETTTSTTSSSSTTSTSSASTTAPTSTTTTTPSSSTTTTNTPSSSTTTTSTTTPSSGGTGASGGTGGSTGTGNP
jgi:hypothetical protein